MGKSVKYAPEVRERAVRMLKEHEHEYPSRWAAIESIAGKIGCTAQMLRTWVLKAEPAMVASASEQALQKPLDRVQQRFKASQPDELCPISRPRKIPV
jgi:transposase-like protein